MPVYTAEMYPTTIRNAGVGACNVAAGLALILTPYLSMLVELLKFSKLIFLILIKLFFFQTKIQDYLLMSILTAFSLFGGLVVIFLPTETSHQQTKKRETDEERYIL